MWIRIFPDQPFTKKWLEMPMGTWKWDVDTYTAAVRKWKILFELAWLSKQESQTVLIKAWKKLSVKNRFVVKGEIK
jgi:large subunit ribosomal protein L16